MNCTKVKTNFFLASENMVLILNKLNVVIDFNDLIVEEGIQISEVDCQVPALCYTQTVIDSCNSKTGPSGSSIHQVGGGNPEVTVDVAEKELGSSAGVHLEQGAFNINNKMSGITGAPMRVPMSTPLT